MQILGQFLPLTLLGKRHFRGQCPKPLLRLPQFVGAFPHLALQLLSKSLKLLLRLFPISNIVVDAHHSRRPTSRVAHHGPVTDETFRWLRKAAGVERNELASILGVTPETLAAKTDEAPVAATPKDPETLSEYSAAHRAFEIAGVETGVDRSMLRFRPRLRTV